MAVKSNKNTVITERFKTALDFIMKDKGISQSELAKKLEAGSGTITNILKNGASAAMMEEVANALGYDLLDMLTEGRAFLEGREPTKAASPSILPEREIELLRKLEAANDEIKQLRMQLADEGKVEVATGQNHIAADGASCQTALDDKLKS